MSARDSSSQSLIAVAEPGHVLALDGVRGFAILAVLAFHLLMTGDHSASSILQFLLEVRGLLWVGVTLFFALSGFLKREFLRHSGLQALLSNLLRSSSAAHLPAVLRISAPVAAGLASLPFPLARPGVALADLHGEYPVYVGVGQQSFAIRGPEAFLVACGGGAVLSPVAARDLPVARLEEGVYGGADRRGIIAGIRSSLAVRGWAPQNHTLFGTMDALLLGGALALLMRSRFRETALRLGMPIFLVATAITLTAASLQPNFDWWSSTYLTTIGMTVLALGMTAFVAASLKRGSITQTVCENSILRFFGRYSYGLYVYHYSLDVALTPPIRRALESRGVPHAISVLCGALVAASVSVAIAVLSYKLYEIRFLQLKRFIPNRRHRERGSEITVPVPLG